MDFDDSGLQVDEAPGLLSATSRRARDRESEAIRSKATSSNVVLHSAMMVHGELGNESARKIHKKLMDDPDSMDDYLNPPKSACRKLTPLEAVAFLLHHVSTPNFPEIF